jgi:hypothetical protein
MPLFATNPISSHRRPQCLPWHWPASTRIEQLGHGTIAKPRRPMVQMHEANAQGKAKTCGGWRDGDIFGLAAILRAIFVGSPHRFALPQSPCAAARSIRRMHASVRPARGFHKARCRRGSLAPSAAEPSSINTRSRYSSDLYRTHARSCLIVQATQLPRTCLALLFSYTICGGH